MKPRRNRRRRSTRSITLGERPSLAALEGCYVSRALGVTVQAVTADEGGRGAGRGVEVVAIESGGYADRAGLQVGDVILSLGDYGIEDVNSFRLALDDFDPDREIVFGIRRRGVH